MTGLEKILADIQADAQACAQGALAEANGTAQAISAAAAEKIAFEKGAAQARAADETSMILARARSSAALIKRKAVLRAKQQIIGETISRAKQALLNLPDPQYFEAVVKTIQKYAMPAEGQIHFSQRDLTRLPMDFQTAVNAAVKGGGTLRISTQTRNIDGGFVLVYGGVEENCSFSALFDAAASRLQDKVNELLFMGG